MLREINTLEPVYLVYFPGVTYSTKVTSILVRGITHQTRHSTIRFSPRT